MKFKVNVIDSAQKTKTITEEADSEIELKKKLFAKNLFIINSEINEESAFNSASGVHALNTKGFKKKDLRFFSYQMWLLLKAGFPLENAIEDMKKNKFSSGFSPVVAEMHKSVTSGVSISEFMKKYPAVFDEYCIGLIKAGEMTGSLNEAFKRIYNILEQQSALKSKIISIVIYPAILIVLSLGFFVFLVGNILPNITSIFEEINVKLPLITRLTIRFSDFFHDYIIFILVFFIVILVAFIKAMKTNFYRSFSEKIKIKIPVIRGIYTNYIIVNITEILGSLLESNIPILSSVETAMTASGSPLINEKKAETLKNIRSGTGIAESFNKIGFFSDFFIKMTFTGEKTNTLPNVFANLNFYHKAELENKLKIITSIIEPAILIVIGAVITFLILSILLPIMQLRGGI